MIILFQDPMGHKPTETPNAPFFPFLLLPSVSEMEKHASLFLGQSKGLQRNAPPHSIPDIWPGHGAITDTILQSWHVLTICW